MTAVIIIAVLVLIAFLIYNSNKSTPSSKTKELFEKMNREIFPGGEDEKSRLVLEVQELTKDKISREDAKGLYAYAAAMFHITDDKSLEAMVDKIIRKSGGRLTHTEAIGVYNIVSRQFVKNKLDSSDENNPMAAQFLQFAFGSDSEGYDADEIPGGFGEFGLVETNPIPVRGLIANTVYLDRLVLANGGSIQYKRMGSTTTANIKKNIDIYQISDSTGRVVTNLYISPYHQRVSRKAPKGFVFKSN